LVPSRAPLAAKPLSGPGVNQLDSGVAKAAESVARDQWSSVQPAEPTDSIFTPADRQRRKDGRREGGAGRV